MFWKRERKTYSRFLEDKEYPVSDNNIRFLTNKPEYVDLAPPRPAKEFMPAWYKKLSREWTEMRDGEEGRYRDESWNEVPYKDHSIKKCPSTHDLMFDGFIIPLWLDLKINYSKETGFNWYNKHAMDNTITEHSPLSIGTMPIPEDSSQTAYKFSNPWDIMTPPGWSVLICQPWYHRNLEIEIMPAIVETDSYHQMNLPFLYHGYGEKIFRQGMPLCQVIPFKRSESLDLIVDAFDIQDGRYYDKSRAAERTRQNGYYRWLTKKNKQIWKDEGIL